MDGHRGRGARRPWSRSTKTKECALEEKSNGRSANGMPDHARNQAAEGTDVYGGLVLTQQQSYRRKLRHPILTQTSPTVKTASQKCQPRCVAHNGPRMLCRQAFRVTKATRRHDILGQYTSLICLP